MVKLRALVVKLLALVMELLALVMELLALVMELSAIVSAAMSATVVGFDNGRGSNDCRNDHQGHDPQAGVQILHDPLSIRLVRFLAVLI